MKKDSIYYVFDLSVKYMNEKKYVDALCSMALIKDFKFIRKKTLQLMCAAYYLSGNYTECIKYKNILEKEGTKSIISCYYAGMSAFFVGKPELSKYLLKESKKFGLSSFESIYIDAFNMFKNGENKKAIQMYLQLKNSRNNWHKALFNIGLIYSYTGHNECAWFFFHKSMNEKSKFIAPIWKLTEIAIEQKNFDYARNLLNKIRLTSFQPEISYILNNYTKIISDEEENYKTLLIDQNNKKYNELPNENNVLIKNITN